MTLFGKREVVYREKNKNRWKAAKEALKTAGIHIMESSFYEDEPPVCGCGPKLDLRDFGPNGPIDRNVYYIAVRPEDVDRAREVLETLQ